MVTCGSRCAYCTNCVENVSSTTRSHCDQAASTSPRRSLKWYEMLLSGTGFSTRPVTCARSYDIWSGWISGAPGATASITSNTPGSSS